MSLLLDALKKAAEQKAGLARKDDSLAKPSTDEASTEAGSDFLTELLEEDIEDDEAVAFQSDVEIGLPLELEDLEEPDDEVAEETRSEHSVTLSAQMQTGDDESMVFTTEVTLAADPAQELTLAESEPDDEDRSEIDQKEADQVGIDHQKDDSSAGDESDQDEVWSSEELDSILGKDLSMSSVDDSNITEPASYFDSLDAEGQYSLAGDEGVDGFELSSIDDNKMVSADSTVTAIPLQQRTNYTSQSTPVSVYQTSGVESNKANPNWSHAPDNYDRTLMKLPGEEASKLFAGMKSDSDMVMSPDYAKKVFQSKSNSQRKYHRKIFVGLALIILLSIGILGLFEMQKEANVIESLLRPLKRDPMPGIIEPMREEGMTKLFTEAEVDSETVELVESVELLENGSLSDQATGSNEVAQKTIQATVEAPLEVQATAPAVPKSERASIPIADQGVIANAPVKASEVADKVPPKSPPEETKQNTKNADLEISSSSRLPDKDRLLAQAYAAYQSGEETRALALYSQVIKLDRQNRNALLARAAINLQRKKAAAAIRDYRTLLALDPQDSQAMTALISIGQFSPLETESQLKLMIRSEPSSAALNFALANLYGTQNRWADAQRHYFTALENNPNDPNYAYNLAVSLEHISKPRVAITYYQRALDNFTNGMATFSKDVVNQRLEILKKR